MKNQINIGVIFNAINRSGNVIGGINGQINRLESRVQSLNSKVNSLFSVGNMLGVGAGLGFLKLGADMEQNNVAFKVMLGSGEKAIQVMNKLNNFSNVTPFQNKEVIAAGRNLIAFGIEADNLESTLQRVGDVASGVRMPFTELSEIYGKIKVSNTVFNEDLNQLAGRGIPIFEELAKVLKVPQDQIKKLSSEGKITFKDIDQAFKNMTSGTGKYAGMMKEMSKTAGGAWSTSLGKLLDGVTKLSVSVMPVMTQMLNGIIPVIDKFNEFSQAHPTLMKNILMVSGGLIGLNIAGKVFGVMRAGALVAGTGILQPVGGMIKLVKASRMLSAALAAGRLDTYSSLIARYGKAGRIAAGGIWVKNKAVSFGVFIGKLLNAETRKGMLLQLRQSAVSKIQAAWTWIVTKSQMVASGITALWGKRMIVTSALQAGWSKIMLVSSMSMKGLATSFTGVIAQTWAWTAALWANPITWIVAGVMALVAAILLAWKHFDWFRGGIVGAWEAVKQFGKILFDSIINPIKVMLQGIGKLIQAFQLLKKKDFSGAWEATKEGFGNIGKGLIQASPVGVVKSVIDRRGEIADAASKGYDKGKAIDTSNFMSFGKKKDQPISAADLQQAGQSASFDVWKNPDMDIMKVPGALDLQMSEVGMMKVPGALDLQMSEVGMMKVPGMLNMQIPGENGFNISAMDLNQQKLDGIKRRKEYADQLAAEGKVTRQKGDMKTEMTNMPATDPSFDLDQLTKNITQNIANNEYRNQQTTNNQASKIEVNYQPQVQVSASMTKEEQDNLMQLLYKDKDRLMKLIKEELRKDGRLSYAG